MRYARRHAETGGLIGLAPAGMDSDDLVGPAPKGAGRFIGLLVDAGMVVLPVGVSEREGQLRVGFGPAFKPRVPAERAARDGTVIVQVMDAISHEVMHL